MIRNELSNIDQRPAQCAECGGEVWDDEGIQCVECREKENAPGCFVAYVPTFRGTGRPSDVRVKQLPQDITDPGAALQWADPMAAHDGAVVVGFYPTRETAESEGQEYINDHTEVDDAGYLQWS